MEHGIIVELDPFDALGWIELSNGARVRFGGTALKGFRTLPGVGTAVIVHGTKPGYGGVNKATRVTPPEAPSQPASDAPANDREFRYADFVTRYPRWSDADDAALSPKLFAATIQLPNQPFFVPWAKEIAHGPISVSLAVPGVRHPRPIDPGSSDSFAFGSVIYLESGRRWPACGRCEEPLEHCIQLSPKVMEPWGG